MPESQGSFFCRLILEVTFFFKIFFKIFIFLAMLCGMQDLSSPTGDWTWAPLQWKHGVLTTGSYPLGEALLIDLVPPPLYLCLINLHGDALPPRVYLEVILNGASLNFLVCIFRACTRRVELPCYTAGAGRAVVGSAFHLESGWTSSHPTCSHEGSGASPPEALAHLVCFSHSGGSGGITSWSEFAFLWWLMKLSTLAYLLTTWRSSLGEGSIQVFCPFFYQVILSF